MNRWRAISALKILVPWCALAFGAAHAADSVDVAAADRTTTANHSPGLLNTPRTPLDLRVPPLRRVMSHSQLLAEMGPSFEDEESIEVVAAPALMPMSSDAQAPLGTIDSLHWSVEHPTQAWRILLPATIMP
jgi:hypothetical protein